VTRGYHTTLEVKQKVGGQFQSIHFNRNTLTSGPEVFTCIPTVIVFLSRSLKAGMEFTNTGYATISIPFTGDLEQAVSFVADPDGVQSGIWIIGPTPSPGTFAATGPGAEALSLAVASGKLSAMMPQQYSTERGFELLGQGSDPFKIAELINFYTHEFKPAVDEEMT